MHTTLGSFASGLTHLREAIRVLRELEVRPSLTVGQIQTGEG